MNIEETFKLLGQRFSVGFAQMGKALQSFSDKLIDYKFCIACKKYPNKKIVHLALHGKNRRIRKKNKDKILKWYEVSYEHS